MDIQSSLTMQVAQGGGSSNLPGQAGTSMPGANGLSFLDLILQQMQIAQDASNAAQNESLFTQENQEETSGSNNPLLNPNSKIDIVALLAEKPEVAEQVKKFSDGSTDPLTETLALNQRVFDELLKPVDGEVSLGDDTLILNIDELRYAAEENAENPLDNPLSENQSTSSLIKLITDKLESLSQDNSQELVATNLTPEQITDLQDYIAEISSGEETELPESLKNCALFIGSVQIAPPQAQTKTQSEKTSDDGTPSNLMNRLTEDKAAPLLDQTNMGRSEGQERFKEILENFSQKSGENQEAAKSDAQTNTKQASSGEPQTPSSSQTRANTNTLQGWPFSTDGSFMTHSAWSETTGDEFSLSGAGSPTSVTGLQTLTSLVTQSPAAGGAHPATQMVAATLSKAAGQGKDTNITMQLDPPELGKIEVQMSFGKDKEFKTKMIIEKPETHAMLQRDSHLLERALQDAGLDLSGESLSFELAQDGHEFSHNGSHDGAGSGYAGGSESAGSDGELIQSTMTWNVDPNTGHIHYSILA